MKTEDFINYLIIIIVFVLLSVSRYALCLLLT